MALEKTPLPATIVNVPHARARETGAKQAEPRMASRSLPFSFAKVTVRVPVSVWQPGKGPTAVGLSTTVLVTEPKWLILPLPQSFSAEPQGASLN